VTVGQIAMAIAQARRTENLPEPARQFLTSKHSRINPGPVFEPLASRFCRE
jgi:hypothetical protein